jgi:hypothetical protein
MILCYGVIFLRLCLHYTTLQFVLKMSADVRKFVVAVQNWFVRFGGCSVTGLYSGSYRVEVRFMFW